MEISAEKWISQYAFLIIKDRHKSRLVRRLVQLFKLTVEVRFFF